MTTDALVPSVALDALLAKRETLVAKLTAAHAAMQDVNALGEDLLGETGPGTGCSSFRSLHLEDRVRHRNFTAPDSLPRFVADIDAQLWNHMLEKSGVWTFMDHDARKRWHEELDKGIAPPLTADTVRATFKQLYAERGTMLEQGVLSLFRKLSWDYKTNTPHKLGKRIVVRHVVYVYNRVPGKAFGGVNHDAASHLDDLIRVFHVLDGKPEPDHRQGAYHTLSAADWPFKVKDLELHGCIRVRGFLNGNAHITFLRQDLVDRCNQILAKHHPRALPPKERE